jgi:preprotein translocase subunit YajC
MKIRDLLTIALALALTGAALAQEPSAPPAEQEQGGGRGFGRGMGMGMGRGVMGTVTEVAADHYTVKNDSGETWTIHYGANTRMIKQPPRPANSPGQGQGQGQGQGEGNGAYMRGGTPPQPIKATDIKVGDAIMAMGETDQAAKSVGAVMVMQLDPEAAKRMEEMRANYGKTWLAGRVTAINETTVTIQGMADNAAHAFMADENTTFRKRREPITLADIQVGDAVRVEGAVKDGQFVATTVSVMGAPQARGGPAPRPGPPPQ